MIFYDIYIPFVNSVKAFYVMLGGRQAFLHQRLYHLETLQEIFFVSVTGRDSSPVCSSTTSGEASRATSRPETERGDAGSLWCGHLRLPRALPSSPRGPEGPGKTARSGWAMPWVFGARLCGPLTRYTAVALFERGMRFWMHCGLVWSCQMLSLQLFHKSFKSTSFAIILFCTDVWNFHSLVLISKHCLPER